MTNLKLIEKLEKKGYPLWKIHSILSLFNVELRPVINISEFDALANSVSQHQALHDAELYIDRLKDWNNGKESD